jgi:hypothetical protein
VGVACWLGCVGPGLFAAIVAITYFAAEAGAGTERWLSTLPVRPRTVWWNRFVAVLALTLPAAGFVGWFVGYCRESLLVIGPAFGYNDHHWDELATYRGYGLLAYLPVLLLAVYAGSSSPTTRWAWVRFGLLTAFFPWLLGTVDAATEVNPLHWLFWAAWTAAGALLVACGLRAFVGAAPQELRRRRGLAGRFARRVVLGWAIVGAVVYAAATHVTPADIVHLGCVASPQGDRLFGHAYVRKWGLEMQRIFLVDLPTKTLRRTPLNPHSMYWHPTRPGVLVDHAPGLYDPPHLPRLREYDAATGRLRHVDIPALRAAWLRRARHVGGPQIDPVTHDVVVWVVPAGENQAHHFLLSADGRTVRDLGTEGLGFAGQDPLGRGRYFVGTLPGRSEEGLYWWPYSGGEPRLIMAGKGEMGARISPDGRWLAMCPSTQVSPDGQRLPFSKPKGFYLGRYDGANLRPVETGPGTVDDWKWSADSRSLFFLVTVPHERQLVRYRLDTRRTEVLASLPAWSPDRSFHLSSSAGPNRQRLYLVEWLRRTERVQWTPLHRGQHVQSASWLWIVDVAKGVVRSRIGLGRWEEESHRPDQKPTSPPKVLSILGWHPDGRLLAQRGRALVAFDPDTREEEVLVRWGR